MLEKPETSAVRFTIRPRKRFVNPGTATFERAGERAA
jgi:hypothetical protein